MLKKLKNISFIVFISFIDWWFMIFYIDWFISTFILKQPIISPDKTDLVLMSFLLYFVISNILYGAVILFSLYKSYGNSIIAIPFLILFSLITGFIFRSPEILTFITLVYSFKKNLKLSIVGSIIMIIFLLRERYYIFTK